MKVNAAVVGLTLFAGLCCAGTAKAAPLASSNAATINVAAASQSSGQAQYPIPGRMERLCQYIGSKTKEEASDSIYTYEYQRIVYEAAGVDFLNDTDAEIVRKVQLMWAQYGAHLRCGPMGVPATGSPLRFAIHTSFEEFITDWLSVWKIDLNVIENGQTTLDFVEERISRASGLMKENLERYRRNLISAGAKRRSEM